MSDSRAAVGMDRLPWLPDEPARAPKRSSDVLGWAVAAALLVAGTSYWLGTRTHPEEAQSSEAPAGRPSATLSLPEPRRIAPGEAVRAVPPPEVRPVTVPEPRRVRAPEVTIREPQIQRPARRLAAPRPQPRRQVSAPARPVAAAKTRPPAVRPGLWPSWQSAGASGRVVQIGAFGTRYQAKRGWWHMARAYPGVRRLPAVVVETRNSRGRPFYRFQIGTTSQAHSEVLCQRMERIRFSCAVVGLPGTRKAVER